MKRSAWSESARRDASQARQMPMCTATDSMRSAGSLPRLNADSSPCEGQRSGSSLWRSSVASSSMDYLHALGCDVEQLRELFAQAPEPAAFREIHRVDRHAQSRRYLRRGLPFNDHPIECLPFVVLELAAQQLQRSMSQQARLGRGLHRLGLVRV